MTNDDGSQSIEVLNDDIFVTKEVSFLLARANRHSNQMIK